MKTLFALIIPICCPQFSFSQTNFFPDSCHTFLWAVINSKGDTSYLCGTFHQFGNYFFDKYPTVRNAYNAAYCIVTESIPERAEINIAPANNRNITEPKMAENWVDRLPKNDYKLINNYLKKTLDVKIKEITDAPPSFIIYEIWLKLYQQQCNTWAEQDVVGMDEYIINGAITYKKRLVGLESRHDTFNVANMMMGVENNDDLVGVTKLKDIITHEKEFRDSINTSCWEAENYRNLKFNYNFTQPSVSDDPGFSEILDKRNNLWIPELQNIIDSHKAFIAIGIKHLFYINGLIMQLANKGYKIIPIPLYEKPFVYKKR